MRLRIAVVLAAMLVAHNAAAEDDLSTKLVDQLGTLFGQHPGYRAAHAKGVVAEGSFTAAKGAAAISKADIFNGKPVPVIFRFSDQTGLPNIPDGDPNATPHGIAIKFKAAGGEFDIVCHSYNGFPVANGEDFLALLQAIAASGPDAPKPPPIVAFLDSHPAAKRLVATPKPAPASYAKDFYYGVNAFKFTNAQGKTTFGRYRIVPVAGAQYLTPDEAKKHPADYLGAELAARVKAKPAKFKLMLQLPEAGDPTNDGSVTWPDSRPQVELGVLTITSVTADSEARQKELVFTPINLIDGIEFSEDPLLGMRSEAYAVSASRRAGQ